MCTHVSIMCFSGSTRSCRGRGSEGTQCECLRQHWWLSASNLSHIQHHQCVFVLSGCSRRERCKRTNWEIRRQGQRSYQLFNTHNTTNELKLCYCHSLWSWVYSEALCSYYCVEMTVKGWPVSVLGVFGTWRPPRAHRRESKRGSHTYRGFKCPHWTEIWK